MRSIGFLRHKTWRRLRHRRRRKLWSRSGRHHVDAEATRSPGK